MPSFPGARCRLASWRPQTKEAEISYYATLPLTEEPSLLLRCSNAAPCRRRRATAENAEKDSGSEDSLWWPANGDEKTSDDANAAPVVWWSLPPRHTTAFHFFRRRRRCIWAPAADNEAPVSQKKTGRRYSSFLCLFTVLFHWCFSFTYQTVS